MTVPMLLTSAPGRWRITRSRARCRLPAMNASPESWTTKHYQNFRIYFDFHLKCLSNRVRSRGQNQGPEDEGFPNPPGKAVKIMARSRKRRRPQANRKRGRELNLERLEERVFLSA